MGEFDQPDKSDSHGPVPAGSLNETSTVNEIILQFEYKYLAHRMELLSSADTLRCYQS